MRISVLGMGRMGQAVAGRLLDGGHEVVIWNRTPAQADALVERGAEEAGDVAEAVPHADVVLTSLANDQAVRDVALGEEGVRRSLAERAVYVDASTVSPALSEELGRAFPRFVSMPILGSPAAVGAGEALYLLGGKPEAAAAVDPLFPGLSERVLHYDSPPLASAAKLTVNLLLLAGVAALAESFAVGHAGGLSDDQLRELLGQSPMVSPGVKNRFEGVLVGDQKPWWSPALGAKDAGLALDLVESAGGQALLAGTVRQLYEQLAADVDAADIADIGRLYRS